MDLFKDLFRNKKTIIGMIHLAGESHYGRVERAINELGLYAELGVDGAIVENYHGGLLDIIATLQQAKTHDFDNLRIGLNVLGNPYAAFDYASKYGATFAQFDTVQSNELDVSKFRELRRMYPAIAVLGGVRFKYTAEGLMSLGWDIGEAKQRCEAIVTTGPGTGIGTPVPKLKSFRRIMGNFPLVDGAGLTARNAVEHLGIIDAAIVGTYFKEGYTHKPLVRARVEEIVKLARNF